MAAWWTKIERENGNVEIKKHDDRKPKLGAMITLNFARNIGEVPLEKLGLYKRDPEKYPDEPNVLAQMIEKEQTKRLAAQLREMMKKPRKKG